MPLTGTSDRVTFQRLLPEDYFAQRGAYSESEIVEEAGGEYGEFKDSNPMSKQPGEEDTSTPSTYDVWNDDYDPTLFEDVSEDQKGTEGLVQYMNKVKQEGGLKTNPYYGWLKPFQSYDYPSPDPEQYPFDQSYKSLPATYGLSPLFSDIVKESTAFGPMQLSVISLLLVGLGMILYGKSADT